MADTRETTAPSDRGGSGRGKGSLPSRVALFFRQTAAELRKVIWPDRRTLVTYTTVVIVFVTALTVLVSVLDYLFGRGVLFVFGGGKL